MLAQGLQRWPGVDAVQTNTLTGSVLVHYRGEESGLLAGLRALGVDLHDGPQTAADGRSALAARLNGLSAGIRQVSGGALDLEGALIIALAGLAIQQAIEGHIMLPAAGLLWYAYLLGRQPQPDAASRPGSVPPVAGQMDAPAQRTAASRTTARTRGRRGPAASKR